MGVVEVGNWSLRRRLGFLIVFIALITLGVSGWSAYSNWNAKQIVEERELSLLYVGCTRARERLLVTWSGQPSRFIESRPA